MRWTVVAAILLTVPLVAGAITEPKTKVEYPDQLTVTIDGAEVSLVATGVGLREKTFAKIDVYVIVSYVAAGVSLGDDPGATLRALDMPKRIQMDLRRGFSRDKLIGAFKDVIEKNYDDMSAFEADMATFFEYFDRDAEDRDKIIFDYTPGGGLTTSLNDEVKGNIDNLAFVEALWTVWFGEKPANGGLKKDLLKAL